MTGGASFRHRRIQQPGQRRGWPRLDVHRQRNYSNDGSTVVDGSLVANNTFTNDAGGRLSGEGTLTANVIDNGTVSPGDSPGVLAMSGDFSQAQAGTLNLEIGGTTAGSQYDQLNVSASATFAGTLNVNLINGFGPAALQTFTVLNFAGMNSASSTRSME